MPIGGRGRCMGNTFIERRRCSHGYEAIYLRELADGFHPGLPVEASQIHDR